MIKNKKKIILICFLIYIITGFLTSILKDSFVNTTESINQYNLRISDRLYVKPFIVDDTGGGNFTWAEAVLQPWCSGSGTDGDPYIIEEIYINGRDLTSCIEIRNSAAHVKIQNCSINNAGYSGVMRYAGIKLNNTINTQLIENWFFLNIGHALVLYNSNYTILSDNLFEDNGDDLTSNHDGIIFHNSHNNIITENRVYTSAYDGFDITECENTTIKDNIISTSGYFGIRLSSCKNFSITKNEMRGNWFGVGLYSSDYNHVSQNLIDSLDVGIHCDESNNNTIFDNTIHRSIIPEIQLIDSIGIWLISCDGNNVQRNEINDKFEAGLFFYLSNYNTIVENSISHATIYGIGLRESNYNNVSRNILTDNEICIEEISCIGNTIEDNICRKGGGTISGFSLPLTIVFFSLSSIIILTVKIKKRKQK